MFFKNYIYVISIVNFINVDSIYINLLYIYKNIHQE